MVTVNSNYSEKLMAVNVDGTDNILAAMKAHPECEKLVYVSSTGAIPEQPKGKPKAIATQHVLDAAKDGMNACVVHPSGILGPNDNAVSETTKTVINT